MSNDHIKSEIPAYLSGALPESRNRQIEAHVASCEKCRHALAKAKAKEARQKREALKKAGPERPTNFFLARQGKEMGVDRSPSRWPWVVILILFVGGGAYWYYHKAFSAPVNNPAPTEAQATPESTPENATPEGAANANVQPSSASAPAAPPAAHAPVAVAPNQEWKGLDSGIKDRRLVVTRNDENWGKLWKEMQMNQPVPPVDFDKHVVVGVFAGPEPSSATITLGQILEREDDVLIPYRVTRSGVAVSSTTAPTHPYLLSTLPRINKRIRLTQE